MVKDCFGEMSILSNALVQKRQGVVDISEFWPTSLLEGCISFFPLYYLEWYEWNIQILDDLIVGKVAQSRIREWELFVNCKLDIEEVEKRVNR